MNIKWIMDRLFPKLWVNEYYVNTDGSFTCIIIPKNDLKNHIKTLHDSDTCFCKPRVQNIPENEKHVRYTVIIHNAMDGRE